MDLSYDLKIPKDRIAVLIGKQGSMKKEIESQTETKLEIDSEEGDIFVSGNDALKLYSAREIIKAVGRGFNPEIALSLLKTDYVLEIINIADFIKNKNHLERIRGRLIGSEGKSRRIIEDMAECNICVYGKTVSVIGLNENLPTAKKAIEMLLTGAPHSTVFKFLEKNRRNAKYKNMIDAKPFGEE